MKVGIIGSGPVAQSLASGLVDAGHHVMIGTRDTEQAGLASLKKNVKSKLDFGTTTQAAAYGELIILAVAWHAAEDVLQQIRPELAGKVIIDVTNPIMFRDDEPPELVFGYTNSGGEVVQQSLPDSHVIKTLNTISSNHMVQPDYKEGVPTMFVCGNNDSAKKQVHSLLEDLGWKDIVDLGDITKCRLVESLALLWVTYGMTKGTWDHAISVLRG